MKLWNAAITVHDGPAAVGGVQLRRNRREARQRRRIEIGPLAVGEEIIPLRQFSAFFGSDQCAAPAAGRIGDLESGSRDQHAARAVFAVQHRLQLRIFEVSRNFVREVEIQFKILRLESGDQPPRPRLKRPRDQHAGLLDQAALQLRGGFRSRAEQSGHAVDRERLAAHPAEFHPDGPASGNIRDEAFPAPSKFFQFSLQRPAVSLELRRGVAEALADQQFRTLRHVQIQLLRELFADAERHFTAHTPDRRVGKFDPVTVVGAVRNRKAPHSGRPCRKLHFVAFHRFGLFAEIDELHQFPGGIENPQGAEVRPAPIVIRSGLVAAGPGGPYQFQPLRPARRIFRQYAEAPHVAAERVDIHIQLRRAEQRGQSRHQKYPESSHFPSPVHAVIVYPNFTSSPFFSSAGNLRISAPPAGATSR